MDKNTLSTFGYAIIAIMIVSVLVIAAPNFGEVVDDSSFKMFNSYKERANISDTKHLISVENTVYGNIEFSTRETLKNGVTVYSAKAGERVDFEVTPHNGYEFEKIEIEYIEKETEKDESGKTLLDKHGEPIYKKNNGNSVFVKRIITIKAGEEYSFIMPDAPVEINIVFNYKG